MCTPDCLAHPYLIGSMASLRLMSLFGRVASLGPSLVLHIVQLATSAVAGKIPANLVLQCSAVFSLWSHSIISTFSLEISPKIRLEDTQRKGVVSFLSWGSMPNLTGACLGIPLSKWSMRHMTYATCVCHSYHQLSLGHPSILNNS